MTPKVVLVGPPGAGKSTVGRLLAERWSVGHVDSDHLVEQITGQSVADLFVDEGEPAFRKREAAAVEQALLTDGVVSLGGGAVLDADTRAALRPCPVVLLRTGPSASASRVGMNRDRPLLLGNVRGTLAQLLRDRGPLYDEVADHAVDTDERDAVEVADLVASWIEGS